MKRGTIISVDVDYFPGSELGLERILELLDDKGINTAFFITGKFAEENGHIIKKIDDKGYEIGCHGYSHGIDLSEIFMNLTLEEQKRRIKKASEILKSITGYDIKIFRAPYAKVNNNTLIALEHLGYKCDSSVTALRFDFGLGEANNIRAFFASTRPYHPSNRNIFKKGDLKILEVPLSAFVAPLTLSGIRTLGVKQMCYLYNISSRFFDPVVFYLHPYEVMDLGEIQLWKGLPKRHKKNRGEKALLGLEKFIDHVAKRSEFILFEDVLEGEEENGRK